MSCYKSGRKTAQTTLHMAHLFISTPIRPPREVVQIYLISTIVKYISYLPLSKASYSFMQLSELRQRGVNKITQALERTARRFEPGYSPFRVWCYNHYTTAPHERHVSLIEFNITDRALGIDARSPWRLHHSKSDPDSLHSESDVVVTTPPRLLKGMSV